MVWDVGVRSHTVGWYLGQQYHPILSQLNGIPLTPIHTDTIPWDNWNGISHIFPVTIKSSLNSTADILFRLFTKVSAHGVAELWNKLGKK